MNITRTIFSIQNYMVPLMLAYILLFVGNSSPCRIRGKLRSHTPCANSNAFWVYSAFYRTQRLCVPFEVLSHLWGFEPRNFSRKVLRCFWTKKILIFLKKHYEKHYKPSQNTLHPFRNPYKKSLFWIPVHLDFARIRSYICLTCCIWLSLVIFYWRANIFL